MQDLRLIGVHEDGEHLLLAAADGTRFRVRIDEPIRAAVRRDRPRLGQLQIEVDGGLRPRDVQALIRAGASAEEVAGRAGWPVEKVRRYEGPIIAEREHVAGLAREVRVRGRGSSGASAPTLATRVNQRLAGRGVEPTDASWDSWRADDGPWTVVLTFPAGGRQRQASWHYHLTDRTVVAIDDEARWLSEDEQPVAPGPIPAPHLASVPVRSSTVYDVEAEGGVHAAATRPVERPAEPLDLMTAMRERSTARSRRRPGGRRDASPVPGPTTPTHVPGAEDAPEEAVPLEHIAYDPATMPPPPPAHGHEEAHAHWDVAPAADDLPEEALDAPGPVADPQGRGQVTREETFADDADELLEDLPEGADEDEEDRDDEPPVAKPAAKAEEPARPTRRNGRPSVPSWDDIMFGARPGSDRG